MRVLLLSRWKFNPYQKLLVAGLRRRGVDVIEREFDAALTAVAEERPDVLHLQNVADGLHTPLAVLRFLRALRQVRGVRIVWTVHDLRLTRLLLKRVDAGIVHCDGVLPGAPNVVTIPHGHYIGHYENRIDRCEARRLLGLGERELVFLFLGWIRRYKGVPELVDAFRSLGGGQAILPVPEYLDRQDCLSSTGARLLIAGTAPERRLLRSLQQRAASNVTIVPGTVADADVQLYMNASDAVVLPYRRSLTSGAAVLAMSFARPCIAPRIGCFAQMLDDRGAFLYAPGGLREALRRAIRHRDDLPAMGEYNRARASTWDWDGIAARTLAVYSGWPLPSPFSPP